MEGFDDDEFSDLYADVEVQASSAIRALHRLTEMPHGDDSVFDNDTRGEKGEGDGFSGAEIDGVNGGFHEHATGGEDVEGEEEEEGGLTKLPMENGDICEGGSESEDDLDKLLNDADDGNKQKFDDNYDNKNSNIEFGATNMRKREGGLEIEEDEKKHGVIHGNEKSVNGGDYNSQRKNLKYDSLNSKKQRVDEMAQRVYKPCKNGDAGEGNDRDLCFSRANEDNQPNFGRNDGKIASERGSRRAHACDPVSLDLEKYGSVQISDSVEDSHHEVSDCDSDGTAEVMETSDDTKRRNASSMSSKVPSAVEPESSQIGRSQHGPGSSCSLSPCAALSDDDIEKSHKHSKNPSSSLVHELQEAVTHENHPSKDSKSHRIKPSTRGGRYYERQRGLIRKELNQHKKSNDMPDLKTHLTDEDASYVIDAKRPYNRHISHGKQRAMLNFNSNEKDMPYRNQSKHSFSYSGEFFPDYHLGPAYLKNQYWNTHPGFGYKAGWHDGHNMGERQNILLKKSSKMDCEALEDDWYHNERRHVVHGNIEESRKLIPKYSSAVNTRGTQFSNKGDDLHFRRRTKGDYLSPLHDYDNKFIKGKHRRFMPSSDRDREHLNHRYDRNIAHDRREMESSGRGKRGRDSPLNSSDNLWCIETVDNDRRYIKHRPVPFYSYEEPCAPGRGRFQGSGGPKSGVPERNVRCSWKEMDIESGQCGTNIATSEGLRYHHSEDHHDRRRHYQQSTNTYVTNESMKDHRDQDHFVRRRHHQQSEVLHSREEVYKSRQQDDTMFHSEGPSYHFERISRNNRTNDRHAFGRVAELIDETEVDRHRFKTMREEDRNNQFDGCLKFIRPRSCVQMHPRYQDSVDPRLVIVGKKCTLQSNRRTSEAGNDIYYGGHDLMEWNDNQKPKNFEDLGDLKPEKAVLTNEGKVDANLSNKNWHDKLCVNQQNEFLDIEEGQIITEEIKEDPMKCGIASEDVTQINDIGHPETASNNNEVVERLGDEKIREIMVKMERRRERFKKPITSSRDSEKTSNQLPDLDVETARGKLERPARKRRWFGT
ncbi:hypothetical protein Pfo_025948 [Paulownia fortunei]|nr:hypothetical protein Pfo_025948 [Paulownia fortunei]